MSSHGQEGSGGCSNRIESELDHFKDGIWKEKSKGIIESGVVCVPSHPRFYMNFS